MNNDIIQLKVKQRLNKLASQDFDNIECWQVVEAFNKSQLTWCRRQLHGMNSLKEGDEQSKRRIDDLQILLTDKVIKFEKQPILVRSEELPTNYFEWKRISILAANECCDNKRKMVVYLAEEANVDELLRDSNKRPSFEWGETFCTLKSNKIHVYTNNEFTITEGTLVYYRKPRYIQIKGCIDPYTKEMSVVDVECEFKDDVVELIIDEAVKILAGDIESHNQQQTATSQVESNN